MKPRAPLNGLKPAAVLAAARPHGDRLRYVGGCRCTDCRRANARYESERQKARRAGDWNGIVRALRARNHLRKLSAQGVGRDAVAIATDIGRSIIDEIRRGLRKRIRARTERKILNVNTDMRLDGALLPAAKSWKLLDELVEEGYSKTFIARRLGFKGRGIQISRNLVTVRNAARVARVHRELTT